VLPSPSSWVAAGVVAPLAATAAGRKAERDTATLRADVVAGASTPRARSTWCAR
jgi:hypothetical protein